MRITLVQRAAAGERFAEGAFDSSVGTTIPVNVGEHRTSGTVVAARVVEDGGAVEVTVEVANDEEVLRLERALAPKLGSFSIGKGRRPMAGPVLSDEWRDEVLGAAPPEHVREARPR